MKSFIHYIAEVESWDQQMTGIDEMAQTIARAKEVLGMLDRSTTDEEDREIKKRSNKEKRSNKILYGKGGRIMTKPPSVTRGDIFR